MDKVTALAKNMKLNVNKSFEDQGKLSNKTINFSLNIDLSLILLEEPSTPASNNEQKFDTNTFVLKKKERRKMPTPANENSFNTVGSQFLILNKKIICVY